MTFFQLDVDIRQKPRHFATARANLEACLGARDTLISLTTLPTRLYPQLYPIYPSELYLLVLSSWQSTKIK